MKVEYMERRLGEVGECYEEGLLPYGGRTNIHGIITYVVSEEEYRSELELLRSSE